MQLKPLFIFLFVLIISVAESTIYSQENTNKYHQSSKIADKKKFNSKKTKLVVFNQKTQFNNYFLVFFFPNINLKSTFQKQIKRTLKLQKQRYQKIASINNQHIFLLKKNTSSNSISNLYIA